MCGISAVVSLGGSPVNPSAIRRLHSPIRSRGPDSEGFFTSSHVNLAHRRLSIVDLTDAASQPFCYLDRYFLVFNGEIYNYKELARDLEVAGFPLRTMSDTEVLVASYAAWGPSCVSRFNGMWAFVLFDTYANSVFCSRDRFGVKPLYWMHHDNQLFLASEPKQLLSLITQPRVDVNELSRFLYAGIPGFGDDTFFAGVKSLAPGHNMSIGVGCSYSIYRWYQIASSPFSPGQFSQLLHDSIDLRLRSDVRVGACLSGGLDSSLLAAMASPRFQASSVDPFLCIHARSLDPEVDESKYASIAADYCGAALETITPSTLQFWGHIREICRVQDEPFGSPSIAMQYFVMRRARSLGCTVMIDGQGADELLLGYPKYLALYLAQAYFSGGFVPALRRLVSSLSSSSSLTSFDSLKYLVATFFSPLRSSHVFRRMRFLALPRTPVQDLYQSISYCARSPFSTQVMEVFKTSLPSLLRYEDRNSMAHSVEARLPFLDYRLVEACLSWPLDSKIFNGWSKYPIRTDPALPLSIAWRRSKLGFNAPERSWIGGYSRQMLSQTLDSPLIASISNRVCLERSWPSLDRREQWRLFNVALWADIYGVHL